MTDLDSIREKIILEKNLDSSIAKIAFESEIGKGTKVTFEIPEIV